MTLSRKWEIGAGIALALALVPPGLGVYYQHLLKNQLIEALEQNKPERVAALVGRGAPVSLRTRRDQTPLVMVAAWRNRAAPAAVRRIVAKGADVNATAQGATALCEAAGRGDLESTRVLLEAGADPNQPGREGQTPLIFATSVHGRPDLIRLLVRSGARVNAPDPQGSTPLMWAIRFGNSPAARQLVDLGADTHARDKAGDTPLRIARLHRQKLARNPRRFRAVAESERLIAFLERNAARPK